jgi:predicted transcriptional regulator
VIYDTKSINILGKRVSIPKVSIEQVKAARALLGWSQNDLAKHSKVSIPTIKRLEASAGQIGGRDKTISAIRATLESAGVEFIAENGGGAGVRLKKGK